MSHWSKWGGLALLAVTALGGAGCDTDAKTFLSTDETNSVQPRFRFIGRVIDKETGGGVPATLSIAGLGAGSAAADGSFVLDFNGAFEDQSGNSRQFHIRVDDGGSHAAREFTTSSIQNDETDPNTAVEQNLNDVRIVDVGTVVMRIGRQLTVVVTKAGLPLGPSATNLRGATVLAYLSTSFNGSDDTFASTGSVAITGQTNSDGIALLQNLDPLESYDVVVPSQNLDGTGGFDFGSESESVVIQNDGEIIAIDVSPLPIGPFPSIISSNLTVFAPVGTLTFTFTTGPVNNTNTAFRGANRTNGVSGGDIGTRGLNGLGDETNQSFTGFITTADGSIRAIFSTPVQVLTSGTSGLEPHFYFQNNLRNEQTAGFNQFVTVAATATRLDASLGTVWTFTPQTPLQPNEFFGLRFFARSTTEIGNVQNFDEGFFYRPVVDNTTIDVALDNYNGTVAGTGAAGVTRTGVYLDFAEPVRGTYKVLRIRDTGRAYEPTADDVTFASGSALRSIGLLSAAPNFSGSGFDSVAFNVVGAAGDTPNDNDLGATVGARYRSQLIDPRTGTQLFLSDNGANGQTREVTLLISIQDADEPNRAGGARLTREEIITLPVR